MFAMRGPGSTKLNWTKLETDWETILWIRRKKQIS